MTLQRVKADYGHGLQPVATDHAPLAGSAAAAEAPRIGPNSVLQTRRALGELEAVEVADAVARRAALPKAWPEGMIPEAWFVKLIVALRGEVPFERAEAVLRRAGTYTADYVGAHRIPRLIRLVLAVLPRRLAVPLLLAAFRRHAWTFAGAGRFGVVGPFPGTIVLAGCPTCRPEAARVGARSGAYYEAAFEGLLTLAAPGVRVREVACQAAGAPHCRFQISLHHELTTGEQPCASS